MTPFKKITVVTTGSRGDVQPYIALALSLAQAGHSVTFAGNINFESLAKAHGLHFAPIQIDSAKFVQEPHAQNWLESANLPQLVWNTYRVVGPTLKQILADSVAACEGAELIIYHAYTLPMLFYVGKQLKIPTIAANLYPMPTRDFPALQVNRSELGSQINRLTHRVEQQITWQLYRPVINHYWQGPGRIPFSGPYPQQLQERQLILCCYSNVVLPRPADWPDHIQATGYWHLPPEPNWQPSAALSDFLATGPRPVYIGFGSMGNPQKARQTTEIVLEALRLSGHRGVLAAGWSGLGKGMTLPENAFVLDSAPHTWLFPRMAAIVHHGGVGTTGSGLWAGVPNVVVPHFGDQPFWGERVYQLGCGPQPIPRPELTAGRLAQAIGQATADPAMHQKAALIGCQLQAEDGRQRALELVNTYLATHNF